jgi:Tfp pilus assembly protein PilF
MKVRDLEGELEEVSSEPEVGVTTGEIPREQWADGLLQELATRNFERVDEAELRETEVRATKPPRREPSVEVAIEPDEAEPAIAAAPPSEAASPSEAEPAIEEDDEEDEADWEALLAKANARAAEQDIVDVVHEAEAEDIGASTIISAPIEVPDAPDAADAHAAVEAPEAADAQAAVEAHAAPAFEESHHAIKIRETLGVSESAYNQSAAEMFESAEAPVAVAESHTDELNVTDIESAETESVSVEVDLAAMMPAEIGRLVDQLRAGRAVLVVGPRLLDGQLTIRERIARLVSSLPVDDARELWGLLQSRPLYAAGYARRRLGNRFAELFALPPVNELPEHVWLLGALPFRAVISTVGDELFERVLTRPEGAPAVYTPADAAALSRHVGAPFVLKPFGDPARPETVALANGDFQALVADDAYRAALHELYRTRALVFVGFHARDLELELLLEKLLGGVKKSEQEHFALIAGMTAAEREELAMTWNIQSLPAELGWGVDELARALDHAFATSPAAQVPADDDHEGWLALLEENPGRADAVEKLDRRAAELREKGDLETLMELLLGRVGVEPEARVRAELLRQVARAFEFELDDAERALTALLAAYKEEPATAEWTELARLADGANAWNDVTSELADVEEKLPPPVRASLYRKFGREADLAHVLDIISTGDDEAATNARREAASLYAKLGDRLTAISRYEALAAAKPEDVDILRALEALYADEGRHRESLEALARQAEAATNDKDRAALYRKLALSWEDEAEGAARADSYWEALLALEPGADDALRALERRHRAERRWPSLVETLRRRADKVATPSNEQAELYLEIATLQEKELGDEESAIGSLQLALHARPDHAASLETLTRLYDATGAWHLTVELLDKRAKLAEKPEQVELIFRAGELAAARLDDKKGAEERFARVLEIDPAHVPSLVALAELHRKDGALLRAAKLLVEAVAHSANRLEKTRLTFEAAALHDTLDDDDAAAELYLATLALDPEHLDAATRVADILWAKQRHEELVPVLEMLTKKKESEPLAQAEHFLRLAHAANAAGMEDKVAKAYARAADLAPSSLEAQREHAKHLMAQKQWASALLSLERVFQFHVDKLTPPEQATLFSQLAECELELGAKDSAREFVSSALRVDPAHRPSLLLQTQLSDGDPRALIEAKRALLVGATAEESARLLGEIGDLAATRINDRALAVSSWLDALEHAPEDHKLLHKCLDAYVEDRAWPEALVMLEKLVAVEKVVTVRAKYRLAAALICRDELERHDEAADMLKEALEDDANLSRAATALEQLYTQREEWKELARLYRRQLKHLGAESPNDADGKNEERRRIWSQLGNVCADRLGDVPSSIAAFEVALSFERDNLDRRKRLADLYVQAHDWEKSIAEHQYILRREKNRVLSYRALKHLYIQTAQREKSVLCSYALTFLKKGEADDQRKVTEFKQRPFATATRLMGGEAWVRLVHPDEDGLIDRLFMLVGPTVTAGLAQPLKSFNLDKKDALSDDDPHSYNKTLTYATATLDVARPLAFARPDQKEAVTFANCIDGRTLTPVFLLGAPLVVQKRREAEQVFELARRVAHLRPERLLRLALPNPAQLAHVIDAAIALAGELDGDGEAPGAVGKTAAGLKGALPPERVAEVAQIGRMLRDNKVRSEDAALAWLQATDLTGNRAGWALAGDLETCARIVAADGRSPLTLQPTERLLDLVWSSTTEELFFVRKSLGLMRAEARPRPSAPMAPQL